MKTIISFGESNTVYIILSENPRTITGLHFPDIIKEIGYDHETEKYFVITNDNLEYKLKQKIHNELLDRKLKLEKLLK